MIQRALAILIRDGRVLLGRRAPDRDVRPDRWDLIGGKRDPGETLEEALAREMREEIGVVPTAFRFLEVVPEPDPERHGPGTYHLYLVTAWSGGEPVIRDAEHTALRWLTPDEACRLPDLGHDGYRRIFREIAETAGERP